MLLLDDSILCSISISVRGFFLWVATSGIRWFDPEQPMTKSLISGADAILFLEHQFSSSFLFLERQFCNPLSQPAPVPDRFSYKSWKCQQVISKGTTTFEGTKKRDDFQISNPSLVQTRDLF
jgi:hypothetical protein